MIQIEDWGKTEFMIGAYPLAVNDWNFIHRNKTFRLGIKAYSEDDAQQIFDDLETGKLHLSDISDRFWNGETDKFILGIA